MRASVQKHTKRVKSDSAIKPTRLPDFLEPMQAKLVDSIRPGVWIYEIKFDGYRAVALRGGKETRLLSRNEKDLGGKFPEVDPGRRFQSPSRYAEAYSPTRESTWHRAAGRCFEWFLGRRRSRAAPLRFEHGRLPRRAAFRWC
jgi:hypothetical protein